MIRSNNYFLFLFLVIKVASIIVLSYEGENFPEKYLNTDGVTPTEDDFNLYLFQLEKTVNFFHQKPNNSDVNRALGLYFMKAILGRTLVDYSHKLKEFQRVLIVDLMKKAQYVVSHYLYECHHVLKLESIARVSDIFRDDTSMVHTIEKLNKNRLQKYLKSKSDINEYLKDFDDLTMPKELYVMLVEMRLKKYHIRINASDECLRRVSRTMEPIHMHEWQPCRPDPFCQRAMSTDPSVAYNLSHRIVNLVIYRLTRQCYWVSPEADAALIDSLCAQMYREAVYIARRGFFSRDLFLEHIILCATMGYEEFHRHNWFHKATSWQDKHGCIQENHNFEVNRTAVLADKHRDRPLHLKQVQRLHRRVELDVCHNHPMALLVGVLAHGVRHAAHYMTPSI